MKKILLCCAAGMSTSLLVNKMKAEAQKIAEENNINIDVINMVDYGMMNGAKVLDQALNLIK